MMRDLEIQIGNSGWNDQGCAGAKSAAEQDANWTDAPIVYTSEGDPLTVNWEKPHFLTVTTGNSHVQLFANLWYSKWVPDYYVELTLAETGKHYLQQNGKLRGQQ